MSEGKPNPVAQALAKAAAGGPHPDAEVLTAFAEDALTARERESLMAHLAGCAECREVLRVSADAAPAGARVIAMPARRLAVARVTPWLAAAAMLVVVSGIVMRQELRMRPQQQAALNVAPPVLVPQAVPAEKSAPVAPPVPAPKAAKKTPENRDKAAVTAPRVMAEAPPPPPLTQADRFAAVENTTRSAFAPQANAGPGRAGANGRVAAARIAPAPQQFAAQPQEQVNSPRVQTGQAEKPATAPAAAPRAPAQPSGFASAGNMESFANETEMEIVRPRWRISEAGEPERAFGKGAWQRVPLLHGGRMHAVAVLGTTVWTGGENSELYGSEDNGATWTAVTLPAKGEGAHTIAHIRMNSTTTITVEAADGTTWTSVDGGATWN